MELGPAGVVLQINISVGVEVERLAVRIAGAVVRTGHTAWPTREIREVHVAITVEVADAELEGTPIDPATQHAGITVQVRFAGSGFEGGVAGIDAGRHGMK